MKIILSRKGFDSQNGGIPSPILPDGTLVSLPIPSKVDQCDYASLQWNDIRFDTILDELWRGKRSHPPTRCHADPDIIESTRMPRPAGWRPSLGQHGAAQRHLEHNRVGVGDVFLFFGWFRQTERDKHGKLRFVSGAPDLHTIFGFLEIGAVIHAGPNSTIPDHFAQHPHAAPIRRQSTTNTLYVGAEQSTLVPGTAGFGSLCLHANGVLTQPGHSRSHWKLPNSFRSVPMTYHSAESWKETYFQSACIGQEFVLAPDPTVSAWAAKVITSGIGQQDRPSM